MNNEGSNLLMGIMLGAIAGAAASYMILKNKDKIRQDMSMLMEKFKSAACHCDNQACHCDNQNPADKK